MDGDDRSLLEAWRAGDRRAGETLIDRHFDGLHRFFRNKLGGDEIDDLIQRTFLGALEGLSDFRGQASFRTWLFAIARHVLLRWFDERARAQGQTLGVDWACSADVGPATWLELRRDRHALLLALRMLPLDTQIALELRYFEQLSGPELAAALELPEPAVRSRLRRGLALLRARLAELTGDPALLQSTNDDLAAWAQRVRAIIEREGAPEPGPGRPSRGARPSKRPSRLRRSA